MSDDVKALIAEARDPKGHVNPVLSGGIIDRLADALEAVQQTPAPRQIEEFEFMRGVLDGANANNEIPYSVYCELHDAIGRAEAAQQAIAVDREALAAVIHERFNIARGRGGVAPLALADQILASGILLDAAEVEARGLEKAEKIARDVEAEAVVKRDESDYPESHYGQHLDGQARGAQVVAQRIAQQVQESN